LEREVLRILAEAGLPRPQVQRKIRRRGAFVARVDFAYPAEMIILEALGYRAHASREQQSADAARASELQLLGHDVHQVTYDQVVRTPAWLVHVVRTALAQSSAHAA
jgi:very-short-patch-repair endonuclease